MAAPLKAITIAVAALGAAAPAASAAQQTNPSDWSRPYGQAPGQETRPYAGARSAGNRVVINGIIQTGVGVSAQANAMANASASVGITGMGGVGQGDGSMVGPFASASAFAVGNQLNVVVNGNYNTVVVNANQTNNGQVTAAAGAIASGSDAGESDDDQD